MANQRVTTVGLDRAAAADAEKLIGAMKRLGTKTSRDELVRALVWGVTAPQAAGMVSAYIMHTSSQSTVELAQP